MSEDLMQKVADLCKGRGIIFPSSQIYGGFSNTWDYGPLGSMIKKNLKDLWWKSFIENNRYNVGIDSSILMNPKVWEVSGHVSTFTDPLIDCKECRQRFRADKLIEEQIFKTCVSNEEIENEIKNIVCPNCKKSNFTEVRNFNLMFKTYQGVLEDNKEEIYLRPETAQGIFINFKNVLRTTRKKIPFGIGQIGKAFRNEITPGNFIFRTREFEQMELEFFCDPKESNHWHQYWKNFCFSWLISIGIKEENLKVRLHEKKELSHYSSATSDIEFKFPFGFGELWGIANRTDFDLKNHTLASNEKLVYYDEIDGERTPFCIEPSVGVDRLVLAVLVNSYSEEINEDGVRTILKLNPLVAPIKVAVLPLSKKLSKNSYLLFESLSRKFSCEFDDSGSIGKRYRRQDEIGTPICLTYDFDSEISGTLTLRDRDTMIQQKIKISDIEKYLSNWLENFNEKFIISENE